MPRLFIAVDLSIATVEKLVVVQKQWANRVEEDDVRIRWVTPENLHVTLKYLGETDEALVPMIDEILTAMVKPLFPFEVSCQRLGTFPDAKKPRILWAGLDEKGAEVMGLLRQTLEHELEPLGFAPDERAFKAHVTLGRVKSQTAVDMSVVVEEFGAFDFGSSYIKDIILYESTLTSAGAEYRVRSRFPLGEV